MKKAMGWIGLFVLSGFVARGEIAKGGMTFNQVVFSENFDSCPEGKPLQAGGKWTKISAKRSIGCSVLIQADNKNIFGGTGNHYLLMSDDSNKGTVRALAKNIPGFSSKTFCIRFDMLEPDDGKSGSFGIKSGIDGVSKKDQTVVNGVQIADGKSRPGLNYSLGVKHHFDLYINESGASIEYTGPDGGAYRLKTGDCAVWIDGGISAKGASMQRALKESVAATSLMLSSYSSSKQEVWFDNIEIAVPAGQKGVVEKPGTLPNVSTAGTSWIYTPRIYSDVNLSPAGIVAQQQLIKQCYKQFLVGTDQTFIGKFGAEVAAGFIDCIKGPIEKAMRYDFTKDAGKTFHIFQDEPGYKDEFNVYSQILQQFVLALAYGYNVNAPNNPYYKNPKVLTTYLKCLEYLYGRGVRDGMTFHYNSNRMAMDGAPQPENGAGNIVKMELRMGATCQSVLLMEPYFKDTPAYKKARALVRHLEMLGKTSGHVRYYDPYVAPPAFKYLAQSDAMQNYGDTTLVSALLETDPQRAAGMLLETKRIYSDSLSVVPGWADTIKPDFVGFHHRGIYGNAYTGGFIPQAAFGVYILAGTPYEVRPESVENVKKLIKTYRLYCQKYSMPFGIRGRMPENTDNIKKQVFPGILIYASSLGLNDNEMKSVFARLWDPEQVPLDFLFFGGRGKLFRGMYCLDMLRQLDAAAPKPEPDPNGFWYKPYGGLAIYRQNNWMAAVKGYSKYTWDYENGFKLENVYGQYFSHGSFSLFTKGDPVSDIASGYDVQNGWDWYRMPGTTAVHFPVKPQKPMEEYRQFSPEIFLGGVSVDGQNGLFSMILNDSKFGDGTEINLKAHKSVFFVNNTILMLGSGISGGDGVHAVETTLFQSVLSKDSTYAISDGALVDPVGNTYVVKAGKLETRVGKQNSYEDNGKTKSSANVAVAWIDHGLAPKNASYEAVIGVRGAPTEPYQILCADDQMHAVYFPRQRLTAFAVFQPLEKNIPNLGSVNEPCLIMTKQTADGMDLALANPDIGLLPKDAPPPTFKFIAEDDNQYLSAQPRPVELTLNGRWKIKGALKKVEVVSRGKNKTVLRFDCLHGMDIRVKLIKE